MTVTYDRFMHQYSSVGREKADGYDRAHFDGLTDEEKEKAFNMLFDEIGVNPDAIEWLFYLNSNKAEKNCLKYIQNNKNSANSGLFILYYHLYKNSGELKYQQKIIDEFYNYPIYQQGIALEYIGKTRPTNYLTEFLKSIILKRNNEALADKASYYYLLAHKIPGTTENEQKIFYDFLDSLKDSNLSKRETTICELDKLYSI